MSPRSLNSTSKVRQPPWLEASHAVSEIHFQYLIEPGQAEYDAAGYRPGAAREPGSCAAWYYRNGMLAADAQHVCGLRFSFRKRHQPGGLANGSYAIGLIRLQCNGIRDQAMTGQRALQESAYEFPAHSRTLYASDEKGG